MYQEQCIVLRGRGYNTLDIEPHTYAIIFVHYWELGVDTMDFGHY